MGLKVNLLKPAESLCINVASTKYNNIGRGFYLTEPGTAGHISYSKIVCNTAGAAPVSH